MVREGREKGDGDAADERLMVPLIPDCRKPLKMFLEQIMLPDLMSSTPHLNYTATGTIL